MIAPEQRAEIRRLYYAEHWRVGTIPTALGVHHDTVRHAIDADRFLRPGAQIRPSTLDPYKPFLLATLEQYPRLRAMRLHEMLRPRGYPGSVDPMCGAGAGLVRLRPADFQRTKRQETGSQKEQ
jgi:hypothetical protein